MHDFTAVGDVVNTARAQGQAAGGEVLLSSRLAHHLTEPVGVVEQLELKGKQEPFEARRGGDGSSGRPERRVGSDLHGCTGWAAINSVGWTWAATGHLVPQ